VWMAGSGRFSTGTKIRKIRKREFARKGKRNCCIGAPLGGRILHTSSRLIRQLPNWQNCSNPYLLYSLGTWSYLVITGSKEYKSGGRAFPWEYVRSMSSLLFVSKPGAVHITARGKSDLTEPRGKDVLFLQNGALYTL